MKNNDDIIFLTADLGYGVFDKIEQDFPDRYINVGIAEQNMIGLATGLSLTGYKVVAYSIGNFASLRCLEQIRNDAAYHNCNITIVSSGAGFTYGQLGMSHHALEDAAIVKMIPGVIVCSPSTPRVAYSAMVKFLQLPGVKYLRLDKSSKELYKDYEFEIEKPNIIKNGSDICILTHGSIINNVLDAVTSNELKNISITLIDNNFLKPINVEYYKDLLKNYKYVIVVEEISEVGGLGSAIADVIATTKNLDVKLLKIGIVNKFITDVGDQGYLREKFGLDPASISKKIINFMDL